MSKSNKPAARRSAWLLFPLLGLTVLAGGCATGGSSTVIAPEPAEYADAVQQRAAAELGGLPAPCPRNRVTEGCSAVHRLVIDYGQLRGQLRAARDGGGDGR